MRLRFRGGSYEQFATPPEADEDQPLTEEALKHLRHAVERGGDEAKSVRNTTLAIIALSVTVLLTFQSQLLPLEPEYYLFAGVYVLELNYSFWKSKNAIDSSQIWNSELAAALYHVEMGDSEYPSRSEYADYPGAIFHDVIRAEDALTMAVFTLILLFIRLFGILPFQLFVLFLLLVPLSAHGVPWTHSKLSKQQRKRISAVSEAVEEKGKAARKSLFR